jgi:hypothetical protein
MEIWRDIQGYEGYYKISNYGNIISYEKKYWIKLNNSYGIKKEIKMKLRIKNNGYESITLYKNTKKKYCLVHRLVAMTFIPNPENKPQINHIDGNKQNNHVNNLEWCTLSENVLHAFNVLDSKERRNKMRINAINQQINNRKKITGNILCINTNEIYYSAREVHKKLNISLTCLYEVLENKKEKIKGLKFVYINKGFRKNDL